MFDEDRYKVVNEILSKMILVNTDREEIVLEETSLSYDYVSLNVLASRINAWARDKGFTEQVENPSRTMLLVISEVIEAFEEYRDGRSFQEVYYNPSKPGKPEGFPIEIAGTIIRLLDMAAAMEINISKALDISMQYNETRPHKHGKAF